MHNGIHFSQELQQLASLGVVICNLIKLLTLNLRLSEISSISRNSATRIDSRQDSVQSMSPNILCLRVLTAMIPHEYPSVW